MLPSSPCVGCLQRSEYSNSLAYLCNLCKVLGYTPSFSDYREFLHHLDVRHMISETKTPKQFYTCDRQLIHPREFPNQSLLSVVDVEYCGDSSKAFKDLNSHIMSLIPKQIYVPPNESIGIDATNPQKPKDFDHICLVDTLSPHFISNTDLPFPNSIHSVNKQCPCFPAFLFVDVFIRHPHMPIAIWSPGRTP